LTFIGLKPEAFPDLNKSVCNTRFSRLPFPWKEKGMHHKGRKSLYRREQRLIFVGQENHESVAENGRSTEIFLCTRRYGLPLIPSLISDPVNVFQECTHDLQRGWFGQ
jgi:hypothetical protein